jgi:hypothetical protein
MKDKKRSERIRNKLYDIEKKPFNVKCVVCNTPINPRMNIFTCSNKECKKQYQKFYHQIHKSVSSGMVKKYNRWRWEICKKYGVNRIKNINKMDLKEEKLKWKQNKNGNV